jgi:hypothetical protein
MRFVEIKIECYNDKDADVVGKDNAKCTPSKCMVNLDTIDSFWVDPDNDKICIYTLSGTSYWTDSFTYEEFKAMINNDGARILTETSDVDVSVSDSKIKLPVAVRCHDCGCLSAFSVCDVCGGRIK